MNSLTEHDRAVTGGIDTHKHVHVAAVVDHVGRILGTKEFPTTPAGHRALPDELRDQLRRLALQELAMTASRFRPGPPTSAVAATKTALLEIARRWLYLQAEIERLDTHLDQLVAQTAPQLVARLGIGTDVAGALLVAAGDNPGRLRSEASFAALCGVSPLDASSGQQQRHRLNRGGDRQANHALWRITIVRMSCDPRTRDYITRRTAQGHTKRETIRYLKRYIAREIYPDLLALQQ